MPENLINWRKQDTDKLKKSVNDFNKKIRRLEKEENLLYLPETISYKDTKDKIVTRSEFNRKVQSLERFMKAGAEELKITKGGEGLTQWEHQETLNQRRIAKNILNDELKNLNLPVRNGLMPDERKTEIEDTLKSFEKFNSTKGAEFKRIKERIQNLGRKDYKMWRLKIYRDNILEQLREISKNNPEMKKLYNYLKNIENPEEFYEEAKKSSVMRDFSYWYKNPNDYGAFTSYDDIAKYIQSDFYLSDIEGLEY